VDLFAPPDADAADAIVELAADEIAHRARKDSVEPANAPASAAGSVAPPTTPVLAPTRKARASDAPEQRGVVAPELPRARYAAGVFLAIVVGFVPAHFFASVREASAFASIDAQVNTTQLAADTPETYAALDAFRAAQLERKQSERRTIALTSMALWGLVGAGIAYVWFRRIQWDKASTGGAE